MGVPNGSLAVNWGSSLPFPTQPSLPVSGGGGGVEMGVGEGVGISSLFIPSSKTLQNKL